MAAASEVENRGREVVKFIVYFLGCLLAYVWEYVPWNSGEEAEQSVSDKSEMEMGYFIFKL